MTKLLSTDGEGERLDRYELIAELAAGGMATVYLARNTGVAGFQRLVAIKRLHPHLAREPEFIEMFLDEARLAARIHHPNVVPIQEVGESERGYYLVMDYVEGDTFARLLARAAQAKPKVHVPYAVTVRVMLDTLAGLHAAHEMKDDQGQPLLLVHRDVSPQNILVGVDGISRITDFGVARAASRLSTTRSGQLKGKLAYMAPEQARGAGIDRRADVFSCGIVLWEAFALKRLFKGEGEAETLNRVLYEPIPRPSSVRPDLPEALDAICMKALERDVEKRYPNALALADDLEKAAQALSVMGSVRDVASCLEQVVGNDLAEQREEVRKWLARSEPSRPGGKLSNAPPEPSSARRNPAYLDSTKTRVEGSSKSVDPNALTQPDKSASSVSSAVLQVQVATGPSSPVAARRSSRMRRYVTVAAIAGSAAALGFAASRLASSSSTAVATAPSSAPAALSRPAAPAAAPPSSASVATALAAPSATASAAPAPSASASTSVKHPRPIRPAVTHSPPAANATATAAPDDLSRNPYR